MACRENPFRRRLGEFWHAGMRTSAAVLAFEFQRQPGQNAMAKKPKLELEPPPSVSSDELTQAYNELAVWSPPLDFQGKVDALSVRVKSCEYFPAGRFKCLREAWVLAEFARLINADRVRLNLVENSPADGYVKISGDCREEVEITEADREERRRGDEYNPQRSDYKRRTSVPVNDAEYVAKAVARAIENRMKKCPQILVVNQNLGVHGRPKEEMKLQSMIGAVKRKYEEKYASTAIYILQNGKLV
jgi:hypothetical protein